MIDINLRAHLLSNPNISNMIGTAVYALRLPQNTKSSAIVYDMGEGFAEAQVGSLEAVVRHSVTLSVYSPNYGDMRQLTKHVTDHLNGFSGAMGSTNVTGTYLVSTINTYEEEPQLYRTLILLNIFTN